jgi:hypothetical protein
MENMKKIFSYAVILVMSFTLAIAKPAAPNESLDAVLDRYTEYTEKMDINKILDLTYHKVFEVIPKKQFSDIMKKTASNPFQPKIKKVQYSKNNEIKKFKNGEYSIVKWDATLAMNTGTTDPKKEQQLVELLKKKLPNTEVKLEKNHTVEVSIKDQIILAIKENGKGWSFVDPDMAKKFKIIPQEIIEDLEKSSKDVAPLKPKAESNTSK